MVAPTTVTTSSLPAFAAARASSELKREPCFVHGWVGEQGAALVTAVHSTGTWGDLNN